MTRVRVVFACATLAVFAPAARADIALWPWSRATKHPWGHGAPPPGWFERERQMREAHQPNDGNTTPQPEDPDATGQPPRYGGGGITASILEERNRRRNGPFRSCGSGAGAGLAAIGVAWGLMWVGHRYAGRLTKRHNEPGTGGKA
jgi:hypothetical protein